MKEIMNPRVKSTIHKEIMWLKLIKEHSSFSQTLEYLVDYYKKGTGIIKVDERK